MLECHLLQVRWHLAFPGGFQGLNECFLRLLSYTIRTWIRPAQCRNDVEHYHCSMSSDLFTHSIYVGPRAAAACRRTSNPCFCHGCCWTDSGRKLFRRISHAYDFSYAYYTFPAKRSRLPTVCEYQRANCTAWNRRLPMPTQQPLRCIAFPILRAIIRQHHHDVLRLSRHLDLRLTLHTYRMFRDVRIASESVSRSMLFFVPCSSFFVLRSVDRGDARPIEAPKLHPIISFPRSSFQRSRVNVPT